MRVIILFHLIFLKSLLFSQVSIVDYKGTVYFRENSLSEWKILQNIPFEIPQGGAIKLDEKSAAKLLVNNNSEVVLYQETALEVESVSKYYVTLGLVYGKGKFDISFPSNSTFVLKTITTNFITRKIKAFIESDLEGKVEISIGLGECRFRYMIPHKSGEKEFVLDQGMFFRVDGPEKPYIFGMIDPKKEEEIFDDVRLREVNEVSRLQRVRKLVSFSNYAYGLALRYTSDGFKEKNSDFESGKTIKDIHGNLVRVEQRIVRPSSNEIQFINITKRPYYKNYTNTLFSSGLNGFRYNGDAKENRIDLFSVSFSFDKNLPQRVENFPSFFSDSNVNANWATFVAANITSDSSFFVAEAYKYNNSRGELVNNTESVGVAQNTNDRDRDVIITGVISKSLLYDIINYNFIEKDPSSPSGNLVKKTDSSDIVGAFWGLKTGEDFNINGDIYKLKGYRYLKGGVGTDYFWLTSESYLISPSGSLRGKKDIEENFDNFSKLLNENFVQSIIYIKNDNNNIPDESSYNGIDDNIDVVIGGGTIHSSLEDIYEGISRWKD